MASKTTELNPSAAFQEQLAIAMNLTGSDRVDAYDKLMTLAAPALQEVAATELCDACVLLFDTNYTDEGSHLYLTGYRDASGVTHQNSGTYEAAMIDEIVFVITGAGEDGSGIQGMRPTSPDCYELHVLKNL